MNSVPLEQIPIIPEAYDLSHYEKVDYFKFDSEMTEIERKFIHGLIRYYDPRYIVELGVSRGGSTINLLNAIIDRPDSFLISIDRLEHYWRDKNVPVGSNAIQLFPNAENENWKLIKGCEPSSVLEELQYKYDFAVIDTTHLHPMESLNFLCLLPFLNDGAIVVLHDVAFHILSDAPCCYATRILMSSVSSHKITHAYTYMEQNIVAFQVTEDTRKYIDNVFDSLFIPWSQVIDSADIDSIRALLVMHYTPQQIDKFDRACRECSTNIFTPEGIKYSEPYLVQLWRKTSAQKNDTIFYGVGATTRKFVNDLNKFGAQFSCTIWDRAAENIGQICGHPVSLPNFDKKVEGIESIVLTLRDELMVRELVLQFKKLGYKVYLSIEEYLTSISDEQFLR